MFLVLWKSLSTNFPFTGNVGTNNEIKRVSYSRLNTQEKEKEEIGGGGEEEVKGFYQTGSKSTHELNHQNENHHNNGRNDNHLMKHSFSMDWNRNSQKNTSSSSSSSSTWKCRRKLPEDDDDDSDFPEKQIEVEVEHFDGKNKDFQVKSHSKFLSGIMFNDESSDADEEDKAFMCDVCDRSFPTAKRLSAHQDKKRHFGCLQCDSIFPSRENLECHREQMNHFDLVSDCGSETTSFESDEEDLLDNEKIYHMKESKENTNTNDNPLISIEEEKATNGKIINFK